jgi:NADH-quinone oxidoreductase subunit J
MSLQLILFFVLASITAMSAVAVVVSTNIVRAAVWLLFTLIGVSTTYFLLDAEFLGAAQLIVYVGGTLVLVIFGVMLTAQAPALRLKTKVQERIASAILGLALFGLLVYTSLELGKSRDKPNETAPTVGTIGTSFMNVKEASVTASIGGYPPKTPAKTRTPMGYLLPFEIVSVHLLVVLIGAAYLARAKRRRTAMSGEQR